MAVTIDKMPPETTGSNTKDAQNILDYLAYLREQVNFALQSLENDLRNQ
ncbi:MAG: hypothetical protein J6V15_06690 [Clostridia bacterium]|nr:hypothetical protein [Clostridia bacterium]